MTVLVVLVGLPGVGKTCVGAGLATELGVAFRDLDDVVAARCGASPAELLRTRGEPTFRALEADALAAVLASDDEVVLATGGGTVESSASRTLLGDASLVVHLVCPSASLLARLGDVDRPLLETPSVAALDALYARRGAWYEEVADARVDASGPIDEVIEAVALLVVRA